MRYELLLQAREPGAPFDPAPVEACLAGKQASGSVKRRPDGVWVWALKAGEIELRVVQEGGKPIAYELAVPFSEKDALVRETLGVALELAEAAQARVVDPTLGRALRIEDEGHLMESYLRAARYAGDYMGVGTAYGASNLPVDEEEGLKPGTRILLALLVFAVFAFLGWRALVR